MAQIAIEINGRSYTVGCGDGEEERLRGLAAFVDGKVRELSRKTGAVGEARLLMLACLTLADELSEASHAAEAARSARANGDAATRVAEERSGTLQARMNAIETQIARREDSLASHLDRLAQRMAMMADRLEAR